MSRPVPAPPPADPAGAAAYWGADADAFRPERFIDTPEHRWPREAFLAFSLGMRACIGQRAGQVRPRRRRLAER